MLRSTQILASSRRFGSEAGQKELSFVDQVKYNFNKAGPYTGIPEE